MDARMPPPPEAAIFMRSMNEAPFGHHVAPDRKEVEKRGPVRGMALVAAGENGFGRRKVRLSGGAPPAGQESRR
jgi:hypothetical protein